MMVISNIIGMNMIILLSLILHCVHFFHLNKKMSARYKVMCGCECCISAKSIHSSFLSWSDWYMKKSKIKAKMLKEEGLARKHITYMKHIKILWCHMGVIFRPKHLIWQRLQCAHIHNMIMHLHTGNVYCSAVPTVHVSILLTKKYIKTWRNNTLN